MKLKDVIRRKIILWDVDNCLLDFDKGFIQFMTDKYPNIKLDTREYDYGLTNSGMYVYVKEFWETDYFMLKEKPGARKTFNHLAKYFDCFIMTAVPEKYRSIREENLKGFKYKKLILQQDKMKYIPILQPDIAIDDHFNHIRNFLKEGIKVYAPRYPYNKGIDKAIYYDDMDELEQMIMRDDL